MKKYTMRNYLKTKGINLNKAKSWTLKSQSSKEILEIRSWITEKGELYYAVKQANLVVKFRGQAGMEDVKSYSDSRISFIVDSVANDLKLQAFVARWVSVLRKGKYKGSWTLKKELRSLKNKKSEQNLDNVLEFLENERAVEQSVSTAKYLDRYSLESRGQAK
jgi:hypothetical protein